MKDKKFSVSGNVVDVLNNRIFPGRIEIVDDRIIDIFEEPKEIYDTYILPGFIDAHVHIESSMLIPSEFARMAVVHGTVATVSDPHEIGNVLGISGVRYMMENGKKVPFKFYFGAPSCVPATKFETSGAEIGTDEVEELLLDPSVKYLSEMMNFPGVIFDDPVVMKKIETARSLGKLIDGHAPALRGEGLLKYVSAGISTDHECFEYDEALEKLSLGMKIIIREGSAAKNFDALYKLMDEYPDKVMLCSDDKHPDSLEEGHINRLVKRAIELGIGKMNALRCACVNPVLHYGLDAGLLQSGDFADLIVIDNFESFNILQTFINGEMVAENGRSFISRISAPAVNNFNSTWKRPEDFEAEAASHKLVVIEAIDGQLITKRLSATPKIEEGNIISDTDRDILKLTVVNRYSDSAPAVAFIKNFGLKRGAIASSVAHDSHNIIAVGVSDEDICSAVNLVIENKGGLSLSDGKNTNILPLPIAGLMTDADGYKVSEQYKILDKQAKKLGSTLNSPYMTLSFMALLVIPFLKLSDKGLFDGNKFEFLNICE